MSRNVTSLQHSRWIGILTAFFMLVGVSTIAQKEFSPPMKFAGEARPIITTTIKFGYNDTFRGIITYVARPGAILRGAVYDIDNNVVEQGDILIQMETDYRQSMVDYKRAALKSAQANLKNAKDNYARYEKLIKTDATSMQQYQQSEADYYAALGNKEAAEADLKLAEVILQACTFRAPFDAVVEKVYFPAGLCAGELDVVRISQLAPMGIFVKMPRELALKITNMTPVKVYPCNSDKPVGTMHGRGFLTEDGIVFNVDNAPLPPPVDLKAKGKTIPVCQIAEVMPFASRNGHYGDMLAVPVLSVFNDAKGTYVWRAIGQRNMVPDRGVDHIFTVEKLYITPEKYVVSIDSHARYRLIKTGGVLQQYDVLLRGPFAFNLNDGDKVCAYKVYYQFMPGDPVRVEIGK